MEEHPNFTAVFDRVPNAGKILLSLDPIRREGLILSSSFTYLPLTKSSWGSGILAREKNLTPAQGCDRREIFARIQATPPIHSERFCFTNLLQALSQVLIPIPHAEGHDVYAV